MDDAAKDVKPELRGLVMTPEEQKRRNQRNLAIALSLVAVCSDGPAPWRIGRRVTFLAAHMAMKDTARQNKKTAMIVSGMVAGMVALSFAAVPAYRVFCQITGWGGTTQRAEKVADRTLARQITIRFDATVNQGLNWRFKPEQASQTLHIGEAGLAFYEAENFSDKPVTGRATFNVTPAKAGIYFKKIECFCFTEQMLQPGEKISMPVTYFIDPALADDKNLDEVQTITLAYTFFAWDNAPQAAASGAP